MGSSRAEECRALLAECEHKRAELHLEKMLGSAVTADVWIFVGVLWPVLPFPLQLWQDVLQSLPPCWAEVQEIRAASLALSSPASVAGSKSWSSG